MNIESESTQRQVFEFSGNAKEYFGIWIVNLGLTLVTLGIYSAWAKVRNNQYFYRNTRIAGSTFDYTADPKKILKGRVIAVVMLLGYQLCAYFYPAVAVYVLIGLLLVVPLIYQSSIAFRMRYSKWRNVSFRFERDTLKMYLLFLPVLAYLLVALGGPMLFGITQEELAVGEESGELSQEMSDYLMYSGAVIGLGGLLFPFWQSFYYNFIGNRTALGAGSFSLGLKARNFYAIYMAVGGFGVLFGLLVFALSAFLFGEGSEEIDLQIGPFLVLYFMVMLFYIAAFALIKTSLTNLIYSGIQLDNVKFESTLKFSRVAWFYLSNSIAILFTIGMAIPWAKIRLARYRAENMFAVSSGDVDFEAMLTGEVDASADAMSDLFDFDIGL